MTAVLMVILMATVVRAGDNSALVLEKMGMFFVGGRTVPIVDVKDPASETGKTTWVEQALVHYLIPKNNSNSESPIVMVPGMGLTSYIFMTTPDGREGWAQQFARSGYPVYVFDFPNYSISGGFNVNVTNPLQYAMSANQKYWGIPLQP